MLTSSLKDWLRLFRDQRSRTISTLVGIGWGTFAIASMMAFGSGLEDLMAERAAGLGQGVVVAWPTRTTLPWNGFPEGRAILVTDEDILSLPAQIPELVSVSPEYSRSERVVRGDRIYRTRLNGVYPMYESMRSQDPEPGGRFINQLDIEKQRNVIFLGDEIKQQLFGDKPAVGSELILVGTPFTVIGVMQSKLQDSDYGGDDKSRMIIPATTYKRIFGDRWVDNFVYRARDTSQTQLVIDKVNLVLGRKLQFDPKDIQALNTWDTTEGDRIRSSIFLAMNVLMGMAGVLTLLVGGIGVGNLMFVQVRRRTREIGLQMAVGAKPRWILADVLLQTLFLVCTGGALGVFAAWLLAKLVGMTPLTENLGHPHLSFTTAIGTAALLSAVGLAAGWFPAQRAAALDPVQALLD